MQKIQTKEICSRIREAREAKGLTMAQMADALELHVNTYGRYERDSVPWKYLGRIAGLLGVSEGWLVRGEVDQADMLRELANVVTTDTHALQALLADVQALTKRVDRMNANLEKLQDSLLPNAERYRGRPDPGRSGAGGTTTPVGVAQ